METELKECSLKGKWWEQRYFQLSMSCTDCLKAPQSMQLKLIDWGALTLNHELLWTLNWPHVLNLIIAGCKSLTAFSIWYLIPLVAVLCIWYHPWLLERRSMTRSDQRYFQRVVLKAIWYNVRSMLRSISCIESCHTYVPIMPRRGMEINEVRALSIQSRASAAEILSRWKCDFQGESLAFKTLIWLKKRACMHFKNSVQLDNSKLGSTQ